MAAAVAVAVAAGSSDVEFIRARSDKRAYRRVVLPNALEVLLISDPETDKVRLRPANARPLTDQSSSSRDLGVWLLIQF